MTKSPGFYTVDVQVRSGSESHWLTSGELLADGEEYEIVEVPAFERRFTSTIQVGEEDRPEIELEDAKLACGQRDEIRIYGRSTHFYPRGTWVSFGPGISVEDIDVHDRESLTALVTVDRKAEPGYRTVVVSTPRYNEIVSLEGGFEVIKERPFGRRLDGRIDRLRFDPQGRLNSVVLSGADDPIVVPAEWEEQLRRAKNERSEIEVLVDEDTGSVRGFEVG
jgi:hypothetical protein